MNSFQNAQNTLFDACKENDTQTIAEWMYYHIKNFPPLIYENCFILAERLKHTKHIIHLIRCCHIPKPGITIPLMQLSPKLQEAIVGISYHEEINKSRKILIYSDKYNENQVSSQEFFYPIIKKLTEKYDCCLVSSITSPATEIYRRLAPCLSVDTNTDTGREAMSKELKVIKASMIIPITRNEYFEKAAKNCYNFSIHSNDQLTGGRLSDYKVYSQITRTIEIPSTSTKKLYEVECAVSAPKESNSRKYCENNYDSYIKSRPIRFGAFCRLMKIDLETLRVWSIALHKYKNSKLYFSYIQSGNKESEKLTKGFFQSQGIDPKRIVFLPRLSTIEYLIYLSKMDIVLGASPEQGGISCTDALMCNIPYLLYSHNSTTYAAEHVLRKANLGQWVSPTIDEFLCCIDRTLQSIRRNEFAQTKHICKITSNELENDYLSALYRSIDHIISIQY